jgi:hypothetical protein
MAQILSILATHRSRLAVAATLVAASLGLAACGSSGSSSSAESSTATPAKTTEAATTAASKSTDKSEASGAEAGGAGLTPPGTQLEPGQSATVAWVPPGSFEPAKSQTGIELAVTVESIEEGSKSDLTNIELEPSDQHAVPFYVHLKIEAPTGQAPPAEEDPAYSFEAIDDREQEQPSVTFLGSFSPCEDTQMPKGFDNGASYETCLTYLINGGGSIQKVQWNSGPAKANEVTAYYEEPIVWTAG